MDQQHYVGLDVSLETTSICVIDHTGAVIWRANAVLSQMPSVRPSALTPPPPCASALRPASSPIG